MGKRAGLTDMKLFANEQPKDSFLSPPETILTRTYHLKIKDIRAFGEPDFLKPQSDVTFPSDEVGMTNGKQIVIPSMGAMSEMFQQHFHILRSLKRRISLLIQAYYLQKDEDKSWEQVEEILRVLERGCLFLAISEEYEAPLFQGDGSRRTHQKVFLDMNLE